MSQSNTVFAVLLFLFVVYITARGKLGRYLALFKSRESEDGGSAATGDNSKAKNFSDYLKGFGFDGGGDLGNADPDLSLDGMEGFDLEAIEI